MSTVNRALPPKRNDSTTLDFRADSYGNLLHAPVTPAQQAADEGSYYVACNALPGTAITASIATAYSGTASGFLAFRNTDSIGGKNLILDYIRLQTLVAPASSTEWQAVVDIDNVLTRFTSGGTATTPRNANIGASSSNTICAVNAGALTTVTLSGNGTSLGQMKLSTVIPVVGSTYILNFGSGARSSSSALIAGTGPYQISYDFPPAVVTPQGCLVLSLFGASNASTAATYFWTAGWIER